MEQNTFVVRRTSDDLQHWKYVKKKKVNGKWRYYYDIKDAIGLDELATYNKAKTVYDAAASKRAETKNAVNRFERKSRNYSYKEYDYKKAHELYSSATYWKETAYKRGQEYMSARRAVLKTPMAGVVIAKETISKGKQAVDNLLKKTLKIN